MAYPSYKLGSMKSQRDFIREMKIVTVKKRSEIIRREDVEHLALNMEKEAVSHRIR